MMRGHQLKRSIDVVVQTIFEKNFGHPFSPHIWHN